MSQDSPFTPGKKVPMEYFEIFDPEDRGHYFWEDQPVWDESDAKRLQQKYYMKKEIADKARAFAIKHEYPEVCAEHNVIVKAFEAGHELGGEHVIGFAKWIAHRGFFLTSDDKWHAYNTRGPVADTTEQLYDKYIQEHLKQQEDGL